MAWPLGKSRIAEASRSVPNCGSRSTSATTRRGVLFEGKARSLNAVAADVVHAAAARLHLVADVRGVDVVVAEMRVDGAQLADAAFVEKLAHAQPLLRAANHEGLADFYAGAFAHAEQRFGFGHGHAERLFAEHMLAGLGGLHGQRHVQLIGQRIVDGVDVGIGEQFFIRAVSRGECRACRLPRALSQDRVKRSR